MILNAIPQNWFSWNYLIMDGMKQVAEMDLSCWREKGSLRIQGEPYKIYREGLMSGAFILEKDGLETARAEKPEALSRRFRIAYHGRQFTLQARSIFGREFILLEGSNEIGQVAPAGLFTRRAEASFLEEISLPMRVFMIWLVIILWKRNSDSGSTSGGAGI